MTSLFIAHDLAVVSYVSDYIAVMYSGKIVEFNTRDEIFNNARHPYTRLLLESIPEIGSKIEKPPRTEESIIFNNPDGCPFYFRCEKKEDRCKVSYPDKTNIDALFYYECFNPDEGQVE